MTADVPAAPPNMLAKPPMPSCSSELRTWASASGPMTWARSTVWPAPYTWPFTEITGGMLTTWAPGVAAASAIAAEVAPPNTPPSIALMSTAWPAGTCWPLIIMTERVAGVGHRDVGQVGVVGPGLAELGLDLGDLGRGVGELLLQVGDLGSGARVRRRRRRRCLRHVRSFPSARRTYSSPSPGRKRFMWVSTMPSPASE